MARKYRCKKCKGKVTSNHDVDKEGHRGLGTWHCEHGCDPCKVEVTLTKEEE